MKTPAILLTVLVGGIAVAMQAQPADDSAPPPPPPAAASDSQAAPAPIVINVAPMPGDDQGANQPGMTQGDNGQAADSANGRGGRGGYGGRQQDTSGRPDYRNNRGGNRNSYTPSVTRTRTPGVNGQAGVTLDPPSPNAGTNDIDPDHIKLNFVNAPLEDVLRYMSDTAHYIVILDTPVHGTVTVQSAQPLTTNEAVTLLNNVLDKNGYAIVQEGRFLTVMGRDDARRLENDINVGNEADDIPRSLKIVTQIIPCGGLSAVQLVKDLAPLLPTDSTLIANEAGNALVITDTQRNIHRLAELVQKLSQVSTAVNSIRIFPLEYADAKATVAVIKELFPDTSSSGAGNNRNGRGGAGGPGGGFPGFMMGGMGGMAAAAGATQSSAQKASTRVLAVAEDNSNSVVISAPKDIMVVINDLITNIDVSVDEIADRKVFWLENADPSEMANYLAALFPSDTTSSGNNRGGGFGGPFGMFGGGQRNTTTSGQSDRAKRKAQVLAVADPRTGSLTVSADKTLMPSIGAIINELDGSAARKQQVYVISLVNADPTDVQNVMQDIFVSSNNRNSRSTTQNNALQTRQTTMTQQQLQSTAITSGTTGAGR